MIGDSTGKFDAHWTAIAQKLREAGWPEAKIDECRSLVYLGASMATSESSDDVIPLRDEIMASVDGIRAVTNASISSRQPKHSFLPSLAAFLRKDQS